MYRIKIERDLKELEQFGYEKRQTRKLLKESDERYK